MYVCINPCCSNVDTFENETCPTCHTDVTTTTADYITSFDSYESCIAFVSSRFPLSQTEEIAQAGW